MRIRINISINRAIQILLTYLFFIVVAESLFVPIFAIFVTGFIEGATLRTVGFALALYALSKSILQIPLARYLDSHKGELDDFYILLVGALVYVVYPFALLTISTKIHLYALEFFLGLGAACLMASYYSLFARHVDKGAEGFEWSLFSVGGLTLSGAFGAAMGGIFADLYGFRFLFIVAGIINFLVFFILLWLYPLLDGARPALLPPIVPIPKNPTNKH